jgi:hypothetical protein
VTSSIDQVVARFGVGDPHTGSERPLPPHASAQKAQEAKEGSRLLAFLMTGCFWLTHIYRTCIPSQPDHHHPIMSI